MKNIFGWIIGIAVLWFIFNAIGGIGKYEGQSAEEWFNDYDQSEVDLENYKTALEEANNNITEANSKIEDAQSCAWGCTYEDMQSAIEQLDTIDTVAEP